MASSVSVTSEPVKLVRFPLGKSRPPFTSVDRASYQFRKLVEDDLTSRPDGMTVLQGHRLATACRAFRAAARCHVLMKKLGAPPDGKLTVEQWLAMQDREVRHSEAVDRALKELGLSTGKIGDLLDQFYKTAPLAPPAATADAQPANGTARGQTPAEPANDSQEANTAQENGTGQEVPTW